ncbi:MAG: T9SS type A sorting domain-containing protein [Bacteroidia bacterium]
MTTTSKAPTLAMMIIMFCVTSIVNAQERCRDFNGTDQKIHIPNHDLNGQDKFTIEAWVNPDQFTLSSHSIIRQDATGVPACYLLAFKRRSANYVITFGINTTVDYKELDVAINDSDYVGKWRHIAATYNGSEMIIYVDGDSMGSLAHYGNFDFGNNIQNHRIGAKANSELYDGRIDEVRIWTTDRSESQIEQYLNCSLTGPKTGLLAVYNLNTTSDSTCPDSSGNGHNGWVNNPSPSTATIISSSCNTLGVAELSALNITLIPNPASSAIFIANLDGLSILKSNVIDQTGRVVEANPIGKNIFNISKLSTGVYYIEVQLSDSRTWRSKFVKLNN